MWCKPFLLQVGLTFSGFLWFPLFFQGKFAIDPSTGVLCVADKLDRETKDSYLIVIEAWDNYQFGYLSGESRNAFKQIQ